jgi:hypothetical protein
MLEKQVDGFGADLFLLFALEDDGLEGRDLRIEQGSRTMKPGKQWVRQARSLSMSL